MRKIIAIAAMLASAGAAHAAAQGTAAPQDSAKKPPAEWEFTVAPYVLAPTMQGATGIGSLPTINVDASASDIFSHLQGGMMLYFQARKGNWAFATDGIYMHLGQDVHQDTGWASGSISFKQFAWEGFVLYQFVPKLEVGLGFVFNKLDGKISATLTPGAGDTTVSTTMSQSWWDPTLAMRWRPISGEHWSAVLFADYGGTSGSNWTWQVMPSVGYRFSKLFELAVQYRWIGIKYSTGTGSDYFVYDMNVFGPQMGFLFHF